MKRIHTKSTEPDCLLSPELAVAAVSLSVTVSAGVGVYLCVALHVAARR
jgi:hypothetical protein